jgi:hypothetical protein
VIVAKEAASESAEATGLRYGLPAYAGLLALITITTFVWPSPAGRGALAVLSLPIVPEVIRWSINRNHDLLTQFASIDYADGFMALQLTGCLLASVFLLLMLLSSALGSMPAPTDRRPNHILLLAGGIFFAWWTLLSGDFYFVHDGDYTGILRPWLGSILFSAVLWVTPLPLYIALASFVRSIRMRVSQHRS